MLAWTNQWFSLVITLSETGQHTPAVPPADISDLMSTLEAVRNNCHIVDAQHATDYTLCVYLLKMREYYRWEHDLPYDAELPREDLTDWLSERESRWETIQEKDFQQVPVLEFLHDPFDARTINHALNALGYVYSSGYGQNMKPMFFMGELESCETYSGYTIIISGKEHARDLASPPAMSQGKTIFVRRESLRRMLWEKVEEWRWNKPANAMQQALGCYDFELASDRALDAMTDNELQSVILHEIGEVQAGELLGEDWEAMLTVLPHSKAEIMARAVRDHLADALSTLPGLLAGKNAASVHFYIANLSNMRKQMFPRLITEYQTWLDTADPQALQDLAKQAARHWRNLADEMLHAYRQHGNQCQPTLVALVEAHTL